MSISTNNKQLLGQTLRLSAVQVIFFLSGFAALLYQISWQRMLFTSFGVDMEAITMIVAVFMLGLGVGGYCGGRIADRFPRHLLLIFTFIELGIGAFGLISADAIGLSQRYFAHYNVFVVVIFFSQKWIKWTAVAGTVLALVAVFALPERIMNNIVDKSSNNLELKELFENRSGIIQVYQDKENNELVFGNNVYDGAFNTSLSNNINGIHRAYLLPVIAPQAKEILVIGLSTGSWISVLTQQPSLEKITVIELNPSYVEFA